MVKINCLILLGSDRISVNSLIPQDLIPKYENKLKEKEEFYSFKYKPMV